MSKTFKTVSKLVDDEHEWRHGSEAQMFVGSRRTFMKSCICRRSMRDVSSFCSSLLSLRYVRQSCTMYREELCVVSYCAFMIAATKKMQA